MAPPAGAIVEREARLDAVGVVAAELPAIAGWKRELRHEGQAQAAARVVDQSRLADDATSPRPYSAGVTGDIADRRCAIEALIQHDGQIDAQGQPAGVRPKPPIMCSVVMGGWSRPACCRSSCRGGAAVDGRTR